MSMDRLWAPWRLQYVATEGAGIPSEPQPEPVAWIEGADRECFLCRAAATHGDPLPADRSLGVVGRDSRTLVVLNRFPYNNGHVLVAPLRHVGDLAALAREEHFECIDWFMRLTPILTKRLNSEGFNIGLNLGRVAGAGVPGHLHWHVVPRWHGDSNFMTPIAGARVIPQSLDALWEILIEALQ